MTINDDTFPCLLDDSFVATDPWNHNGLLNILCHVVIIRIGGPGATVMMMFLEKCQECDIR